MRQYFLLILMLQLLQLTISLHIPCQAKLEQRVQYRKIFWYKVTEANSVIGLVMKDLCKNNTVLYKHSNHSYEIRDDLSLVLLSKSRQKRDNECETYRCSVWPPVGHRIQEGDYSLPQGCQNSVERRPEFANQAMDMQIASKSHVYSLIPLGVLCVALLLGFVLQCKNKEKHKKVPV